MAKAKTSSDIIVNGDVKKQRFLKYQCEMPAVLEILVLGDRSAMKKNFAACNRQQAAQNEQESGLPGAIWSDHSHHLARIHREIIDM
jgi:hypothetical protein